MWLNLAQIYFITLQSCQACSWNVAKGSSDSELSVALTCFLTEMRFIARFANNSLKTATGAAMLVAGSFCHFALAAFLLQTRLWRYTHCYPFLQQLTRLSWAGALCILMFWFWQPQKMFGFQSSWCCGFRRNFSSHMFIWEFKEITAVFTFNFFHYISYILDSVVHHSSHFRSIICNGSGKF